MSNRLDALREIARTMVPGGRLVVSVWRSGSPFGTTLRKVLGSWFGKDATSTWDASISLGDRHELHALAEEAGFKDCHVKFDIKIGRHHAPEEFISGVIAATPLSDEFTQLPTAEQRKLVYLIIEDLEGYIDDVGLAYPAECHTLTARSRG
jgi:SAM-dependent methyltransferase